MHHQPKGHAKTNDTSFSQFPRSWCLLLHDVDVLIATVIRESDKQGLIRVSHSCVLLPACHSSGPITNGHLSPSSKSSPRFAQLSKQTAIPWVLGTRFAVYISNIVVNCNDFHI